MAMVAVSPLTVMPPTAASASEEPEDSDALPQAARERAAAVARPPARMVRREMLVVMVVPVPEKLRAGSAGVVMLSPVRTCDGGRPEAVASASAYSGWSRLSGDRPAG